jgi:very-short-patch-repair endonuclease
MRCFSSPYRRRWRLEQFAWCNRRMPTDSEARLWAAIRGRRLGVQFRRQVPLGDRFIVDFFAPAARLVVEVDGGCHLNRQKADSRRDRELSRLGYRVLRLPAAVVTRNLGGAVQRIAEALRAPRP